MSHTKQGQWACLVLSDKGLQVIICIGAPHHLHSWKTIHQSKRHGVYNFLGLIAKLVNSMVYGKEKSIAADLQSTFQLAHLVQP